MTKRTVELAQADQLNRGGRRYPLSILQQQEGREPVHGELGHPVFTGMDPQRAVHRCRQIDFDRVTHLASNFRLEDGVFLCDIEPWGPHSNILEKNFDAFDFAMRGLCAFEDDAITVWHFELVTVDAIYRG